MVSGLVGRKCGMTRVFTEDGISIPVTVIEIEPNRVTQIKSLDRDGYAAVQVSFAFLKMLIAALMSRSWCAPHWVQVHSRTFSSFTAAFL